jgi:hypothetical protein
MVKLPNGHEIEVRGLKRREIKPLKKYGYHRSRFVPVLNDGGDIDVMDEAVDAVLDKVLSKDDLNVLDDCEPRWTNEVWLAVIKETYGAPDEEKNS